MAISTPNSGLNLPIPAVPEKGLDPIMAQVVQNIYNSLNIIANNVPVNTQQVAFTGTMSLGLPVNLYSNAGVMTAQPAVASTPLYADGFVSAIGTADVEVTLFGQNVFLNGLTPGVTYYLGASGGITSAAPSNKQILGKATSSGFLYFNPSQP